MQFATRLQVQTWMGIGRECGLEVMGQDMGEHKRRDMWCCKWVENSCSNGEEVIIEVV